MTTTFVTTFTKIGRRYHFEAAHFLPLVPEGHRCKRMHGHNYEIEVTLGNDLDDKGFVLDFGELDQIVNPIIALVDHQCLNEVDGLQNPTAEIIGAWFFERISDAMGVNHALHSVKVFETKDCWAIYEGGV